MGNKALVVVVVLAIGAVYFAVNFGRQFTRQSGPPPLAPPVTWKVELHRSNSYFASIHPVKNGRIACVLDKSICFINAEGEIVREQHPEAGDLVSGDLDSSGNLFVCGTNAKVFSYDQFGIKRWETQLPGNFSGSWGSQCYVDENGQIIVLYGTGELAVLTNQGKLISYTAFPFTLSALNAPIWVSEDRLAVTKGGHPQELAVVDLDGNEIWALAKTGSRLTQTVRFEDFLVTCINEGEINAISFDGNLLWSFVNPDPPPPDRGHKYQVTRGDGNAMLINTGRYMLELDHKGKTLWKLTNKYVTPPLIDSKGRLLFVEFPDSTDVEKSRIQASQILTTNSLNPDVIPRYVNLVEARNQRIIQRWALPDQINIADETGKNGEVYGYTMGSPRNNVPVIIYRFDL